MDLKVKQNWQHLYDQYLKSGMTKADFCKLQKIPHTRFFITRSFMVPLTKPQLERTSFQNSSSPLTKGKNSRSRLII